MAAPSVTDAVVGAGSRVGRYFSLTSVLPMTALVLWTYALAQSGAVTGRPNLDALGQAFAPSLGRFGGLVLAVVIAALFVHPLQFGMTQFLEGYWGARRLPLALSAIRANHYRARVRRLDQISAEHQRAGLAGAGQTLADDSSDAEVRDAFTERDFFAEDAPGDAIVRHLIGEQEADRKRSQFPLEERRIMPTRLGNALRREEDKAGRQYGINAMLTAPHFSLVAQPEHARYIQDARQEMDTTLRLCVVSLLATLETVAFLFTDGPWLLVTLVPYGFSYLAYRAGVAAARNYGATVATVIDLNRFAFYQALNLRWPRTSSDERRQNLQLMSVLAGNGEANLSYRPEPRAGS